MPRVTITVPERTPQPYRFPLDRKSVTLGRGSENDIAIDCGSVSVKHAEMLRVPGGYELRDLGSTNGIKENGERRMAIKLRNGVTAQLGDVDFDFLLTDEELEALAAEKPEEGAAAALPSLPEMDKQNEETEEMAVEAGGGGGVGTFLLFLIFAAVAFVVGMAIRHQNDTGESLLDALKTKAPAAEAPAGN